jgi:peroxiredoxin
VLTTCVLLLGATVVAVAWPRITHTLGVKPAAAREAAYRTGQTIDVPAEWYQSSPYTVLLFARASCGACQQAQPFFKQLVAGLKGRASVVLAGSDQEREDDATYGRALGLKDPSLLVAPAGLKVRATPTLVLINQRGEILGAWEGVGPPEHQTTIAKAIDRAIGV